MKIELESTTKIVEIVMNGQNVPARIWEGKTVSGIPVHAYITRIAVSKTEKIEEFEKELQEHRTPSPVLNMLPLRVII